MQRRILKNEAVALRGEIDAISRRIGKGAVSDADVRSAESKAALATLMEVTANSRDVQLNELSIRSGSAANGATGKWASFGDFLAAVYASANPANASPKDHRLVQLRAASGLSEQVPSDGGFAVPTEYSMALIEAIGYESTVAARCMRVPLTKGNKISFPMIDERSRADGSRWGGINSAWLAEGASLPLGKPKFRSAELNLNKLAAGAYATEELVADTGALAAFVAIGFTLEGAYRLDEAVISGNGAGQPLGILNSRATITVAKQGGQAAGTIVAQNLLDMFGRMLPECRKNAVWFVSPEVEENLYVLPVTIGTAGSTANLFTPADAEAPYGRLMNRPVIPCEQCSNIGTPGDIIFADPRKYLIAEKPLNIALSMHVRFVWDEGLFRMTFRVDGRSAIHEPITPLNGGATKSAFAVLAAR